MVVGFGGLLEVVVIASCGFDGEREREREKYELLFILLLSNWVVYFILMSCM